MYTCMYVMVVCFWLIVIWQNCQRKHSVLSPKKNKKRAGRPKKNLKKILENLWPGAYKCPLRLVRNIVKESSSI